MNIIVSLIAYAAGTYVAYVFMKAVLRRDNRVPNRYNVELFFYDVLAFAGAMYIIHSGRTLEQYAYIGLSFLTAALVRIGIMWIWHERPPHVTG